MRMLRMERITNIEELKKHIKRKNQTHNERAKIIIRTHYEKRKISRTDHYARQNCRKKMTFLTEELTEIVRL